MRRNNCRVSWKGYKKSHRGLIFKGLKIHPRNYKSNLRGI